MKISAILFDKDGTLIDYHQTWMPINWDVALFAAGGCEETARRLLSVAGWGAETNRVLGGTVLAAGHTAEVAELWQSHGAKVIGEDLVAGIDKMFAAGMADAVPVTDLRHEFVTLRRRGFALGVASSDSAAGVAALTHRFDLADCVDFEAGYDSGHGVKPGPGMLQAFCATVGCAPSAVAVVGDNTHDMAMATSGGAGLRIAVLTGTGTREDLEPESDHCIDSIHGFDAFLESIGINPSTCA